MKGESRISVLGRLRRSRLPLARALLALFTSTWLGLAVQPCMADDVPAGDPVAPIESAGHAAGCGGAPAPEPTDHDCPHCPPGGHDGQCGTALDCEAVGVPAMVGKATELPRADLGAWIDFPVSLPAVAWQPARGWVAAGPYTARASPRSLQQRFCTYLK